MIQWYAVCGMRYAVCGEHCAHSQFMPRRLTCSNWVNQNSVGLTRPSFNYSHSTLNNFYSRLAASLNSIKNLRTAAGLIALAKVFIESLNLSLKPYVHGFSLRNISTVRGNERGILFFKCLYFIACVLFSGVLLGQNIF